jgi:hypothetical protein
MIKTYISYLLLLLISISCKTRMGIRSTNNRYIDNLAFNIEGTYQSESSQMGFSEKKEMPGYEIEVKADTITLFYRSDSGKKLISVYNFYLKNENNLIFIESKLINGNDLHNWFNGILTFDKRKATLQFSNGIEIDGGPLTIWQRNKCELLVKY